MATAAERRPSVFARIRPGTSKSAAVLSVRGQTVCVPSQDISVSFTNVHHLECEQQNVYDDITPTVDAALEGINATIMTYGQTGSGKTFTLLGRDNEAGILPRVCARLAQEQSNDRSLCISISMVEIYCERLKDLLSPDSDADDLIVHRDEVHGYHVRGAALQQVTGLNDMMKAVNTGISTRAVRSTGMNEESSRSHLLVNIFLQSTDASGRFVCSKLCLADLAGSERQSKTKAAGASLAEGAAINKSLSTLGNVLIALSENRSHVPFRESKLTRLLQDCMAGNALMSLIVCLSADSEQLPETVSTLRFGSRALGITNVVTANKAETLASVMQDRDLLRVQLLAAEAQLQDTLQCRKEGAHASFLAVRDGDSRTCGSWKAIVMDVVVLGLVAAQTVFLFVSI